MRCGACGGMVVIVTQNFRDKTISPLRRYQCIDDDCGWTSAFEEGIS